ncbi:MAG TPA: hypothetical protein VET46_00420 [Steroidobacteraceae bacterium]|nr:hypothetical protein [Steroidobacteraceae bacterium]
MRLFLSIAAILAWLFGAALLLAPAKFYEPIGVSYTPMLGTVAQAHGATLIGLGVVTWLGRTADRQGLIALLGGSLVVQILSLLVALRTMSLGAGAAVTPAIIIHVVLGSLFGYFLFATVRARAAAPRT